MRHLGRREVRIQVPADRPRQISLRCPFLKGQRYFCVSGGRWKCKAVRSSAPRTLYSPVLDRQYTIAEVSLEQE